MLILSGCVSVQTVVSIAETPKTTVGYVAGVFSSPGGSEYGFGITNINGGEEIILPFADLTIPNTTLDRVTMIQLPAGQYRISSWVLFDRLTKEKILRKDLPAGEKEPAFIVKPGRVQYLGKFAASGTFNGFKNHYRIQPQRISQQDLALLLEMNYPNFSINLLDIASGLVY